MPFTTNRSCHPSLSRSANFAAHPQPVSQVPVSFETSVNVPSWLLCHNMLHSFMCVPAGGFFGDFAKCSIAVVQKKMIRAVVTGNVDVLQAVIVEIALA